MKRILILVISFLISISSVSAASFYTTGTGSWFGSIWSTDPAQTGAGWPSVENQLRDGDFLYINHDIFIDKTSNFTIDNLVTIVIGSNVSFTLDGKITLNHISSTIVFTDNTSKIIVSKANRNSEKINIGSESNTVWSGKYGTITGPGVLNHLSREGVLPIVLDYFKTQTKGSIVELSWATHSEQNFDYFSVERSMDAKTYETIATINGNGWSESQNKYATIDAYPLIGMNYYRLKAVDFDGYTEYFAPISVFNNNVQLKVATVVGDHQLRIFSNLSAEARIYNLQGLPVHSGVITSGVNDINLPATVSSGYYIVGIYAGNELVKKEKVFVQ